MPRRLIAEVPDPAVHPVTVRRSSRPPLAHRFARRLVLLVGIAMALSVVAAPGVAAQGREHEWDRGFPSRIMLPDGFQPEGITSAWGQKLYVGSLVDGAIWKGSALTGRGDIFIAGEMGKQAVGIKVDWRGRLWVAGGGDRTVRVYNARNGDLLKTYSFPTAGFINDLVVTRWGVYATDSFKQQLLVVPFKWWGGLPNSDKAKVQPISGDLVYADGFNANGIEWNGRWLVVVQSNKELLFRVNPRTGDSDMIDLHGYSTPGDGLILRGRYLWVVNNPDNLVAVIKLNDRLTDGRLKGEIDRPALDVPSTATFAAGQLYVVNARFGVADPANADYWVTKLPIWPR